VGAGEEWESAARPPLGRPGRKEPTVEKMIDRLAEDVGPLHEQHEGRAGAGTHAVLAVPSAVVATMGDFSAHNCAQYALGG
jgi:hypothetical protein